MALSYGWKKYSNEFDNFFIRCFFSCGNLVTNSLGKLHLSWSRINCYNQLSNWLRHRLRLVLISKKFLCVLNLGNNLFIL